MYGSRDVLEAECKNLHERIELELDGRIIRLPQLEGIVILNINSWCGGCQIWNNTENGNTQPQSKYVDLILQLIPWNIWEYGFKLKELCL